MSVEKMGESARREAGLFLGRRGRPTDEQG
jgi:hypothetical protein